MRVVVTLLERSRSLGLVHWKFILYHELKSELERLFVTSLAVITASLSVETEMRRPSRSFAALGPLAGEMREVERKAKASQHHHATMRESIEPPSFARPPGYGMHKHVAD